MKNPIILGGKPIEAALLDCRTAIVDIRGGVPDTCDFCHTKTPEQDLHPEEAGMWICITCIKKDGTYFGKHV